MTVRRFRVLGDVPEGFRDVYRERLRDYAFRQPPNEVGRQEIEGWVSVHNLLDADFEDFNRWMYDTYMVFALRVDKKSLPAKLFRATLEKRCQAWCEERGVERCPGSVKSDLKEQLEDEWLRKALPRVGLTEVSWSIKDGYALVYSLSEGAIERVRKRFHQTFGLKLIPWSPLDWLDDRNQVENLLATGPVVLNREDT